MKTENEIIALTDAIIGLTESINDNLDKLIVTLKQVDRTYEYPYPEEKVWSNGSGVEGEQEADDMFKHPDCFGEKN